MSMNSVTIICKKDRPEPEEILRSLVPWLRDHGLEVLMFPHATESVSRTGIEGIDACPQEQIAERTDMAVVLGGDGTMLGAARLLAPAGIPILGVNLGELGFITEVASLEVLSVMESVLKDRCCIEERTMLTATILGGIDGRERPALNDILVTRGSTPRIIALEVSVNGKFVNTFRADGIVVATPTGSTAYSLSADGPILYPTLNTLVMTPVCPHTLTNRPIVLPDDVEIRITLKSAEEATVMHDGQVAGNIEAGQTVVIRTSPYKARLIMPPNRDHFAVLRGKLGWGSR
ncbi:NAD(+)/NADH kinase [Nitrospirota bacterium]